MQDLLQSQPPEPPIPPRWRRILPRNDDLHHRGQRLGHAEGSPEPAQRADRRDPNLVPGPDANVIEDRADRGTYAASEKPSFLSSSTPARVRRSTPAPRCA